MKRAASLKRWLWLAVAVVISTLVYFTIRYGLRPKPIPVMNVTSFEKLEEIGAVAYRRLRQEVRGEKVILIGSDPEIENAHSVWTGFLKAAAADGLVVQPFYQRLSLLGNPGLGDSSTSVIFKPEQLYQDAFLESIKAGLEPGKLMVVHGLSAESSHLVEPSFSRSLDRVLQHPVLAISTLKLKVQPEEIENSRHVCMEMGELGRFECARARVGRILAKKSLEKHPIWAVMERHGLKEYLIFIYPAAKVQ